MTTRGQDQLPKKAFTRSILAILDHTKYLKKLGPAAYSHKPY